MTDFGADLRKGENTERFIRRVSIFFIFVTVVQYFFRLASLKDALEAFK